MPAIPFRMPLNVERKLESTVAMSWLKRFKIRPVGVVSKNDIGARMILARSSRCMTLAAVVAAIAMDIDVMNSDNAANTRHYW